MKRKIILTIGGLSALILGGCSSTSDVPMPEPEKIQPIHVQQMHELVEVESSTVSLKREAVSMMKENFNDMGSLGGERAPSLTESRFDDVLNDFKSER